MFRKGERKQFSGGVGTGGLVSVEALDRENDTTASAVKSSRKLFVRTSWVRTPSSSPDTAARNVFGWFLDPPSAITQDTPRTPASPDPKTGPSSCVSTPAPSALRTPLTPQNKPLPALPRIHPPDLPQLVELPADEPVTKLGLFTPERNKAMGLLIVENGRSLPMDGFNIQRPKTASGVIPSDLSLHRRHASETLSQSGRTRDASPTPLPLFSQLKNSMDQTRAQILGSPVPIHATPNQSSPSSNGKKRTASGSHPVHEPVMHHPISCPASRDVELEAMRAERDCYAHSQREAQEQIQAALSQLNRSQINERLLKAQLDRLKTQVDGLDARLEDSNGQRLDALEQNHFLEGQLQRLVRSQANARRENEPQAQADDTARLHEAEEKIRSLERQLDVNRTRGGLSSIVTSLTAQVDQFARAEQEKDAYIQALEQQNTNFRFHLENLQQRFHATMQANEVLRAAEAGQQALFQAHQAATSRLAELERRNIEQESQLRYVQTERDQTTSLLQAELRRQAIVVNEFEHPNASQLGALSDTQRMMAEVGSRVGSLLASSATQTSEQRIERLEKEIDYHVKDIVLYKLDVKGYKKDLKRANAKIKKLLESEGSRQTLSPTTGMAPSPSLSCASTATSSGAGSAHPMTPSPSFQGGSQQMPFSAASEPTPKANPAQTLAQLPITIAVHSLPPELEGDKTPSLATYQMAVATNTRPQSTSPSRGRSQTGPARSFTSVVGGTKAKFGQSASVPGSPMWPSQSHTQTSSSGPSSMSEESGRPNLPRAMSEGSKAFGQPAGRAEARAYDGKLAQGPPRAIDEAQRKGSMESSRNSLQNYPDVPNGGLPPVQMWSSKKGMGVPRG